MEADPAVLNLSAFETFFSERRPFFLEGSGIFTFNTDCGDIDSGCTGLFYSRRIGRNPQLGQYADDRSPTQTTILGASKLTGRIGNGLSLGFLDAVTQREVGPGDKTIEPQTNFAVMRLSQETRKGQGDVGIMLTGVNRSLDALSSPLLRESAYSGGVDLRQRMFSSNYELRAYLAGSRVAGSPTAIAATQRSSVHYYQRPDDALAYDPTRTSLTGNAQRVSFSKFGGGITRFQTVYQRFSPGFETNDVGYLQRADMQMFRNWFSLNGNKPTSWYRRAFINFNTFNMWNTAGTPLTVGVNVNTHGQMHNQMWWHFGVNYNDFIATYDDRYARGGPAVRNSTSRNFWAGIEGDQRNVIVPYMWFGGQRGDDGQSHGFWLNPTMDLRAASNLSASLGVSYNRNVNGAQYYSTVGTAGSDTARYLFANLNQTTVSLNSRFNYTATPTLSLQVYAEPFVSTGTYTNLRRLSDPTAAGFDARYTPYAGSPGGFNMKEFRSNSVLRWEYRPGSTLFVVWQQGRSDFINGASDFRFGRDYGNLFGVHPDNTFLVKLSYWFNP